jgi:DNA polymerase-3 subunit gamma/tau
MEVALYRKYRPQSFKEIKGQDHIVSVLENEAKTGKVSHAVSLAFLPNRSGQVARIFTKWTPLQIGALMK